MTDQFTDEVGPLVRVDLFRHPKPAEDVTAEDGRNILGGRVPRRVCLHPTGKSVLHCQDVGVPLGGGLERPHKVNGDLLKGVTSLTETRV